MATDPSCTHPATLGRREFLTTTAAGLTGASCASGQRAGDGPVSAAGRPGSDRRRPQAPHPPAGWRRLHPRPEDRRLRDRRRADRREEDCRGRSQPLRGRCRDDRLLGHDRHARLHHHPPSPVRNAAAEHHPGRHPPGRLAAGKLRLGRPEHLDGRPHRRSAEPCHGHLGSRACAVRPGGLLHLAARRLPERDQRGRHLPAPTPRRPTTRPSTPTP